MLMPPFSNIFPFTALLRDTVQPTVCDIRGSGEFRVAESKRVALGNVREL